MKRSNSGNAVIFGLSFGVVGLLCAPQQLQAASATQSYLPQQLDLALGLEAMTGDTKYSIGGNAVLANGTRTTELSPASTLEWPLDIWLAKIDAGWTFNPAWRVNGTVKTNLSDPNESIIDRDWLTSSMPQRVDVYSASDVSSLDALIIDIDLEWTFWQQGLWSAYAGAGYQHQKFAYKGGSTVQHSPSGLTGYNYSSGNRTAVTYDLTYSMPYLLLGSEYQLTPQLRLTGNLSVAPLISAEDETLLLLRNKTTQGDLDGFACLIDLSGIYYLTPWWYLEAGLHHVWTDVEGEQYQMLGDQALGKIDMEAESKQTSGYLSVGYSF